METDYEKIIDVRSLCSMWADRVASGDYMDMYASLHGWRMLQKGTLKGDAYDEHWMLMDVLMQMERDSWAKQEAA